MNIVKKIPLTKKLLDRIWSKRNIWEVASDFIFINCNQKIIDHDLHADDGYFVIRQYDAKWELGNSGFLIKLDVDKKFLNIQIIAEPEMLEFETATSFPEKLFQQLTPFDFGIDELNNKSMLWRKNIQFIIDERKKMELRIGDILSLKKSTHANNGLKVKDIRCVSLKPLRFSCIYMCGDEEQEKNCFFLDKNKIISIGFSFLERGKRELSK